jgi:hypothetical protein
VEDTVEKVNGIYVPCGAITVLAEKGYTHYTKYNLTMSYILIFFLLRTEQGTQSVLN